MSQNQQAARVIKVEAEGVQLFDCHVQGIGAQKLRTKEDPVSLALRKVDLSKEVKLVDYSQSAGGDLVSEHLAVMHRNRDIPLNPQHADFLYKNPALFPNEWKGSLGQRIYVGFPGVEAYLEGSKEALIVVLWWDGFSVRRGYASRAGENRQAKFYFATFVGNPFAAK